MRLMPHVDTSCLDTVPQASVRDRMCTREEAKLYEDGEMLSSNWAELGT